MAIRPIQLLWVRGVAEVEQRVRGRNLIQRAEHGFSVIPEAVADHPLDLADPDRHARELSSVRIDLETQDGLRPDPRDPS